MALYIYSIIYESGRRFLSYTKLFCFYNMYAIGDMLSNAHENKSENLFFFLSSFCFQGPEGKPGIEGRPGIPASKVCTETANLDRKRVLKRRITPSSPHAVRSNYIIKRQNPTQHDPFPCGAAEEVKQYRLCSRASLGCRRFLSWIKDFVYRLSHLPLIIDKHGFMQRKSIKRMIWKKQLYVLFNFCE